MTSFTREQTVKTLKSLIACILAGAEIVEEHRSRNGDDYVFGITIRTSPEIREAARMIPIRIAKID